MENRDLTVNVEYLTRVEGHGNILINVREGRIERCEFQVVESPRFFEGMLRGRSIFEAQHITSRICGICSCGHSLCSIQAAEEALGVVPSPQTIILRKLLLDYEMLDSHLLHIYFLALPDIASKRSIFSMLSSDGEIVRRALRMKKLINDACQILAGRHVHPITCVVGGFAKLPGREDLKAMLNILDNLEGDIEETLSLGKKMEFPRFTRETEYVALISKEERYPLLSGDIGSSDGKKFDKRDYRKVANEFVDPRSTAKFARFSRQSYMVGALARFNLNGEKLHPRAKRAAGELGLEPVCHNPYFNTIAQIVECIHCFEDARMIIQNLFSNGVEKSEEIVVGANETGAIPIKAGTGIGAIEVPRGTLFHNYEVDEKGQITNADCVIPTNQNINNLKHDMEKLLPEVLDKGKEEVKRYMEMLVRAYDPCISCSAHYLNVEFTE